MNITNIEMVDNPNLEESEQIKNAHKKLDTLLSNHKHCVIVFDSKAAPISTEKITQTVEYLCNDIEDVEVTRIWVDDAEAIILKLTDNVVTMLPFFMKGTAGRVTEAIPFAMIPAKSGGLDV